MAADTREIPIAKSSFADVRPGDPLRASAWNDIVGLLRDAGAGGGGMYCPALGGFRLRPRALQDEAAPAGFVIVRNDSGSDRDRYDVLGINGPVVEPADDEAIFRDGLRLKGILPAETHRGRYAVLAEPIVAGDVGRAVIDGLTIGRVEMVPAATASYERRFADIIVGDATKLRGRMAGGAAILWAQPESEWVSNVAECVLRVGIHAPIAIPHIVKVKKVSGAAGDEDDPCAFLYDIWPADAAAVTDATLRLATGLTPECRASGTFPDGQWLPAEDGSRALAHYVPSSDSWVLIDVPNERFVTAECT